MSDIEKSKNKNDEDGEEWRKTQIVKRPKLRPRSENNDDNDEPETKHTTILSEDNILFKRAISQNAHTDHNGTTAIGNSREVILLVRGMAERIVMQETQQYTLGRFEMGVQGDNEIDLTPYGAVDRGVSRHHAILHLEDDHIYLTDLNSTNGTYVGGEKLPANTPTIIHKGDEVLLGRLAIQVMFR